MVSHGLAVVAYLVLMVALLRGRWQPSLAGALLLSCWVLAMPSTLAACLWLWAARGVWWMLPMACTLMLGLAALLLYAAATELRSWQQPSSAHRAFYHALASRARRRKPLTLPPAERRDWAV